MCGGFRSHAQRANLLGEIPAFLGEASVGWLGGTPPQCFGRMDTGAELAALSWKRVLPMRLAVRRGGRERDGAARSGASIGVSDGYDELAGGLTRLHVGVRLLDLTDIESTVHRHADLPFCHGIEKVLKHGGR